MRRLMVLVAACVLVLAIGGVEGGQAQTPNPCVDSPPTAASYTYAPNEPIIVSGRTNAAFTVVLYAPTTESGAFDAAYTGNGRFQVTLTSQDGRAVVLAAGIHPGTWRTGPMLSEPGIYRVTIEADATWSLVIT